MSRKQQSLLDFNLARKSYILREAVHYLPHFRMVRVLRVIDDLHFHTARDQQYVTLTHREIAERGGMSVPTVRRGIEDLIKHDYLIKKEIVTSYGQAANQYKIAWSILDAVIIDGESSQVLKVAGDHFDQGGDHEQLPESTQVLKVGPDQSDQGGDQKDQASLSLGININTPPPSNNSSWKGVEDDLQMLGVGLSSQAITIARKRGCSPEDVQSLIAFARSKPGAYGPGAIYKRVIEGTPGGNPSEFWPAESDDYRRLKRQRDNSQKHNQAAQDAAERTARIEAKRKSRENLERDYGPILDQMTLEQIQTFATEQGGDVLAKLVRTPDASRSGFARSTLLSYLKKQVQPEGVHS